MKPRLTWVLGHTTGHVSQRGTETCQRPDHRAINGRGGPPLEGTHVIPVPTAASHVNPAATSSFDTVGHQRSRSRGHPVLFTAPPMVSVVRLASLDDVAEFGPSSMYLS